MSDEAPFLPFRNPHAYARRTDPRTSRAAARSVTPRHQTLLQRRVWELLFTAATDAELVTRWRERWPESHASDSSIRTRRHELTIAGLVEPGGVVRLPSRRQAIVWRHAAWLSPPVPAPAAGSGCAADEPTPNASRSET